MEYKTFHKCEKHKTMDDLDHINDAINYLITRKIEIDKELEKRYRSKEELEKKLSDLSMNNTQKHK